MSNASRIAVTLSGEPENGVKQALINPSCLSDQRERVEGF